MQRRDEIEPPRNYKELKGHPLEAEFCAAMREYLNEHETRFHSWIAIPTANAKNHQVLGYHWVFTIKRNSLGHVQKYKAWLVVRGDQQPQYDLPTCVIMLASISFRILLTMIAFFDLEIIQLDAVNTFVHTVLPSSELVYMRSPPGFPTPKKVLRLNKALYGLRRSPLL